MKREIDVRGRGECVGVVDFGSREIRVLIGRKDSDGVIQVIGHGAEGSRGCISQGVVQDLSATQVALKKAMAAAVKESRVKIDSLFCAVNGRNVETSIREGNVKLERQVVQTEQMDEALDIASRGILAPGKRVSSSVTAQEWYVDDMRVKDPIGIRGHVLKVRVHFAVIPTVIEDNLVLCIESQRCDLEDFIFTPLAAGQGCLAPEDMECGVAVLDIGRGTTGLAVYRDYRVLATHCFEWGGYQITRDVAAGLQITFEEAGELVMTYGLSDKMIRASQQDEGQDADDAPLPEDAAGAPIKLKTVVHGAPTTVERAHLEMIVFERANELMTRVRQHLHARGLVKNLVRGVVLTGGGSAIKNQAELAQAVFKVPCRVGAPNTIEILPNAVRAPEYSASVGLIRYAFEYRAAARGAPRGGILTRRLGKIVRKYFF